MPLRILHCVEFYHPSPGGAQAVVRQVSEELVRRGHSVTVATTRLPERRTGELNGVRIEEFDVAGNTVRGLTGEVDRYRRFVLEGDFDVLMAYAAQQWTTDALLPVLDQIPYRKLLAPCGFAGLADPAFGEYFSALPEALAKFDQLIFHSHTYQDIEFARKAGLESFSVIPNGASRAEFEGLETSFRVRHGIAAEQPLLLTVGPHNWRKGHALAIDGFRRAEIDGGVLAVIGNEPLRLGCQWDCRRRALSARVRGRGGKRVKLLDPPREEVLAAYKAADLFLFGSQVECSPLVLFEAAASGTPFVSVAAGNAAEIAEWTGAGAVVPSSRLADGRVTAAPEALSAAISRLWEEPGTRRGMAEAGREAWLREFTWERIAGRYEDAYTEVM
jgi:glycosyltransferase involved in cell wall biosynthesis